MRGQPRTVIDEKPDPKQIASAAGHGEDRRWRVHSHQSQPQRWESGPYDKELEWEENPSDAAMNQLSTESEGYERPNAAETVDHPRPTAHSDCEDAESARHECIDEGVVELLKP